MRAIDTALDLTRPGLSDAQLDVLAVGTFVREIQGRLWSVIAIVGGPDGGDVAILATLINGEWRYRTATRRELHAQFTP